jgi:hypothetical protein
MLSNSIFNGSSNMGIDINDNGYNYIDSNDPNDADTGPNNMLNSPGYTNITENGGNTDVTFTIDVPAGNYRIEFFSNSSAVYQGQTYLGFMNITHTGSGLEQFTHTLSGTGHTNLALTATEINPSTPSGFGATSELGRTGNIPPPPPSPISDLSITKRLLNPEDKSLGGVLRYEIKVRNLGPNNFNLANLNSTIGGQIVNSANSTVPSSRTTKS